MTDDPVLLTDSPAPGVRRLTLNRPDDLNTLNSDLCQALHDEFDSIAADRTCRVVIVTGAGRGFCAGLDLHGYGQAPGNDGSDDARDRLANQQHMSSTILKLRSVPQPVIAAVNGPAAGFGFALACAADIRYAAAEAVFRVAFVNIGVSNCDMGTSWLLPRLVGASRAFELMLTARRFGADEAAQMGLVADVVAGDALLDRALEGATQIAALAPWAIRLTKQGMYAALETPAEQTMIEYEDRQQILSTHGVAVGEAIGAFLEKRPAGFPD